MCAVQNGEAEPTEPPLVNSLDERTDALSQRVRRAGDGRGTGCGVRVRNEEIADVLGVLLALDALLAESVERVVVETRSA